MLVLIFDPFLGTTKDDNRRLNHLTSVHHRNGLYSSERLPSKFDCDEFNRRKIPLTTKEGNDHHRTVLARHSFHANIKQTLTRSMRETPV